MRRTGAGMTVMRRRTGALDSGFRRNDGFEFLVYGTQQMSISKRGTTHEFEMELTKCVVNYDTYARLPRG